MTVTFERPFNQKIRIAGLRLSALALLPVLALSASSWDALGETLLHTAGILCVVAAVLGRFWSILYIGGRKNRTVMQDGPYSLCRHPLYLFSTAGAVGFGLMLGSLILTALFGGIVFTILSLTAAREEGFLRHSFGAQYDNYARRVPRMLPALGQFRTPVAVTFDTGTLARNTADALVFLGLIPLAEMTNWLHAAHVLPSFLMP
ncbi:methyltransferase family protein [Falsirhodobacter sp. 20TX0035]|uniref:methyltransferase family protein n=1 Tax=Falsirhodobacter sp. 20TX0035 TaxID=3022019 RepID=UPI0023302992|nr:isoprenylcysteine carboxylmethyltransferase family protein [Falsirhodobacter sp. 20TX0035]MDB6454460.1 isoprenylcysteine carboxylmethyltransferase family protein [Falsirhodobacter sp. 20TX0035]